MLFMAPALLKAKQLILARTVKQSNDKNFNQKNLSTHT